MSVTNCPKCNAPLSEFAGACVECGETPPSSIPKTQPPSSTPIVTDNSAEAPTIKLLPLEQQAVGQRRKGGPGVRLPDTPENAIDVGEEITQGRIAVIDRPLRALSMTPGTRVVTPRYLQAHAPLVQPLPRRTRKPRRPPPSLFFWLSMLVLAALVVGGLFGVVVTLGRGIFLQSPPSHNQPTLQVTPTTIALGAIISIRGSNFSPNGNVGMTRDANIPIFDTGNRHIIQTDNKGSFIDTIIVAPDWQPGQHQIHVEDATLHKIAGSAIVAIGRGASLRPAHIVLSTNILDLGSDDQAANSTQIIVLSNAGGGMISWQATSTQPWLLASPTSGTFSSDQTAQVAIAGNRSNLKPGTYQANVMFQTSAGQSNLSVKMQVTPLRPGHAAVLQLSPAVLSFTGTDGGYNPPGQVVTVSNPGVLPLQWNIYTSRGSGWLSTYPQSGTLAMGNSQAVSINVNTATLLPGIYSAYITFTGRGPAAVKDSLQSIYVSLTVTPQCMLQVSPGDLTFTAVSGQGDPAAKTVNLSPSQSCSAPLHWSAASTAKWLSIGSTRGVTPGASLVSTHIAGLAPGTYNGAIIFSSTMGTQTLPVSLMIARSNIPVLAVTPASLSFQGITGQANPPAQTITITNSGGGTLTWNAAATTTVGSGWLAVSPTQGGLTGHTSATLQVTATLIAGLSPMTYNGMITLTGTDSSGHNAVGSPQSVPVSFVVQAPCAIVAAPAALSFAGVAGQPDPPTQSLTITTAGACKHTLNWTATPTTSGGGNWLSAAPATGTIAPASSPATGSFNPASSSATAVKVTLADSTPGPYNGKIVVSATDSVTGQPAIGQSVTVTLNVQPPCTLQTPSATALSFSTETGINPAGKTFTVGVTGACNGNVTITPTTTTGSGLGWLTTTPPSATLASGEAVTFTVSVTANTLSSGPPYTGSISLAAANGGMAISGSPQAVSVTLNVLTPPALNASPGQFSINVTSGITTQPVAIANAGGAPLNWTATLDAGAPAFVSLSANSGANLAGGTSTTVSVIVDATGLPGGSQFTTGVVIGASDAITGNPVGGAPVTVSITINIAPPAMQLSSSGLSFVTTVGNNPGSQAITITNIGGNTLTWTASTPSQPWLSLNASSGSNAAGASSTLTFSVNATGMTAGSTATATVTITPSPGTAITVTVIVTVN